MCVCPTEALSLWDRQIVSVGQTDISVLQRDSLFATETLCVFCIETMCLFENEICGFYGGEQQKTLPIA